MRFITVLLLSASLALPQTVRLTRVIGGLQLPVDVANAGDSSGRLFIVEKRGVVRILRQGALTAQPFLNITERVNSGGSEQGLLGIAFPPDFAAKRHFYVNYTDRSGGAGNTVVSRFRLTADPNVADPASEQVLLTIRQPFENHNGGQILFNPRDGYLYVGMGDGGSGGDPQNNAQRGTELLGKMLRIDVESGQTPYRIPPDNPFAGRTDIRPEIWATGLRNPWRFAFDRANGDLFIADVGQNRAEEVNYQPGSSRGGENYGWRLMEGLQCFNPASNCDRTGLTMPILEYGRSLGVSVTGGKVYRGRAYPALIGMYFYADFGSGNLWSVRREGQQWVNRLLLDTDISFSAFGEDEAGELYAVDLLDGVLYRLEGRPGPAFTAAGVVSAASFAPGLAPGSIATLFGAGLTTQDGIRQAGSLPLPTELDGVRVLVNGVAAPIFAVARVNGVEQVNFQVPLEVTGPGPVRLEVSAAGQTGEAVQVEVATVAPALFTQDGRLASVVRPSTGSVVRSVRRGEVVSLYGTGLGAAQGQPGTGQAVPPGTEARLVAAPLVTLGGATVELLFAGLAPSLVGVQQLNVRVPEGVPAGEQELVITVGGVRSQAVRLVIE